ncbi:hypothetical protein [Citricoccus sp. I39-566]|uniref:hypothetical protein n=1 Tax=Citricoccus sp. I39-566 TaxID=3073268 RepID=UPI00286C8A22|nr:hypothetical protein [Citricoccus sp. I39-566]WMY77648.1 hypothetical protein RE421_12520 [Citricoccus sp. I39-566]
MDFPDALTGAPLLLILAVLALVDSTSFGTLAVPAWFLMAPGGCAPAASSPTSGRWPRSTPPWASP